MRNVGLVLLGVSWLGCPGPVVQPQPVGGGSSSFGGGGQFGGGGGGAATGGGGAATGGGGVAGLSLEDYRAGVAAAVCGGFLRCGQVNSLQGCLDSQSYTGAITTSFWASARASVAAGRSLYDPAKAQACLDYLRDQQPCDFSAQGPCEEAFRPAVADGAPCLLDGECAVASYCSAKDPNCPGTCQPRKAVGVTAASLTECVRGAQYYDGRCLARVALGASCAPSGAAAWQKQCVPGAWCAPGNVCAAQGAVGSACTSALSCLDQANCVAGVCTAPRGLGQVCRYNVGESCLRDLHCERPRNDADGTCQPYLAFGAPCSSYSDCKPPAVCTGGDPYGPNGGSKGQCTATLATGAACKTYEYSACGERGWCRPGTASSSDGACAARLLFGQACTGMESGCPADGVCIAGVCRRYYCAP